MSGLPPAGDVLAAVSSAVVVGTIAARALTPATRLRGRVRPYGPGTALPLDRQIEPEVVLSDGTLRVLFNPVVEPATRRLDAVLERGDSVALARLLARSGLFDGVAPARRVLELRVRQLLSSGAGAAAAGAMAVAAGRGAGLVLMATGLGLVAGAMQPRRRVERAVRARRARLRREVAPIAEILAVHLRVGVDLPGALERVVARGSGVVVAELEDVLDAHRAGLHLADALRAAADRTVEPAAARLYRLLAREGGSADHVALWRLARDLQAQGAALPGRPALAAQLVLPGLVGVVLLLLDLGFVALPSGIGLP